MFCKAKKILRIRIALLFCLCTYSSLSSVTVGASRPDIQIGVQVPDFVFENIKIPSQFLTVCRYVMYTIPMDPGSDNPDLNATGNIPVIPMTTGSSGASCHPLQFLENRQLIKTYMGGRNVVITDEYSKGNPEQIVVITGMGPKYDSQEKRRVDQAIGAETIDIIDVLPKLEVGAKEKIRNLILFLRHSIELRDILKNHIDFITKKQITKILDLDSTLKAKAEIYNPLLNKCAKITSISDPSMSPNNFKDEYNKLEALIRGSETDAKEVCLNLLTGLSGIVETHMGATAAQKKAAMEEITKIIEAVKHKTGYWQELIIQVTSLEPSIISTSLTGLRLIEPFSEGHQKALGDLFHSEPLYTAWVDLNSEQKKPGMYFFTQRDMCMVCDRHVCRYLDTKKRIPCVVLSARIGNTPGPESVDEIYAIDEEMWKSHAKPNNGSRIYKDVTNHKLILRYRLLDLYPEIVISQAKKEALLTKITFLIQNFEVKKKQSIKQKVQDAIILGVSMTELVNRISSLEQKDKALYDELMGLISSNKE